MDELTDVLTRIIHREREQSHINPAWIANAAMQTLDPKRISPPAVYGGCNLYARQVARSLLRKLFESDEQEQSSQHEMFPELQWRYPVEHKAGDEPQYVLLENMTDSDIAYNVLRLRSEAEAKLKHADALEAYGRGRRKRA